MAEPILLTTEEAAELLRVESQDIIALVKDGTLAGLRIRGHWRITSDSIAQFLSKSLRAQNLKAISRKLGDPSVWARLLEETPELKKQIENKHFEPGSMGELLQEALAVSKGMNSGKVVQFRNPTDEPKDS